MMRVAEKSLIRVVRLAGLLLSLWTIVSFFSLMPATPAFANDQQICTPQVSACCNTCGDVDHSRPSCPLGQSLYDDYCLPDCPLGFIRYPGVPGLCMPPVEFGCPEGFDQVPLPSCPQGYVRDLRDPDHCLPDYGALQNGGECPYGMAWSNGTGRCEVDCPQGTYLDGHGLCQSYYGRICPEGYARDGETGRCLPPGIWPPNYGWVCLPTCPQGFYRDIRHPTRCLPPPPSCPQGFDNLNGRCVPTCEKGTLRDNYGYCVPPTCPDGTYPNLRGQCQPVPCPEGTLRNSDGVCAPPHTGCPQGTLRNSDGVCAPPHAGCPQGAETYNGQCVPICNNNQVRDANGRCVPPPRTGCPQGTETYHGQCVPICKDGLVRDNNGRCIPPPQQQPNCPKGYRPDGNGGCTRIIRLVPRGCPDGTILNRRTQTCVPLQFQPGDNGYGDVPPAIDNPPPPIMLNPGVLRQLMPQGGNNGGANLQSGCPAGTFRDNNGRCVGKQ